MADARELLRRAMNVLGTCDNNDPLEPIADNGMTVWDGMRSESQRLWTHYRGFLAASRPPVQSPSGQVVGGEGLVALVESRIGRDFDGECHLTEAEARSILAALRSQPAPDDWRPFETAPKDGTPFLAYDSEGVVAVVKWDLGFWLLAGTAFPMIHLIHWRPLPDPPQPVEQGE